MRPDGDPEPDDYGLPHVDVVVPDDARELDRDIVAYRREERQRRRRARLARLARPFTRFGVAVPIISGALLIALVSGLLMTAFGPRPTQRATVPTRTATPTASPGYVGGYLPTGVVSMVGRNRQRGSISDMAHGVIAVVPPDCGCGKLVNELATRTQESHLQFWLVIDRRYGPSVSAAEADKQLRALGGAAHGGVVELVDDATNLLATTYVPDGAGPTAILVKPGPIVTAVIPDPTPGRQLSDQVKALTNA
ncbi:hypothetical protein J4573_47595 [Actinomadura barringtoniae]|uniref:Uncharacterized protein n=1 Tax=Actinomadura barringtoniae TaxID=1427535 RepID=A0A939T9Z3_9ACTN|nr:hypothetical protein [Actinomadura barringtoniae]MBO2454824.1 hypothetical protein [Actinomadura barringtoniae]